MEGCVEVDYMQSLMIDGDFSFPVYASSLFCKKVRCQIIVYGNERYYTSRLREVIFRGR